MCFRLTTAIWLALELGAIAQVPNAVSPDRIRELEAAANRGDTKAQFQVGRAYLKGEGVPKNFDQAFIFLDKAAAQGDPEATGFLAVIYERGLGKPQDLAKALELYRK